MKSAAPASRFHFFGEPMGLILGALHSPLHTAASATLSICGAESNVSIGLARLGHPCTFHTVVGNDPYGERVIRTLRAEGIDVGGIRKAEGEVTGLLSRTCHAWREPDVFYHRSHSAFSRLASAAAEAASRALRPGDTLFTTGITPAVSAETRRATQRLIADARERGATVCLDANLRRKLWSEAEYRATLLPLLPQIEVLFLSLAEGEALTQESDPAAIIGRLFEAGASEIVIKDGAHGAHYHSRHCPPLHMPAFPLERVVDPIGAGDAFDAGFLAARARGEAPRKCLETGAALGALACLTPGDWESLPSPEDLERFLSRNTEAAR